MNHLTPEQIRLFRTNELVEAVELLLQYNAYLSLLLGQTQARYRQLEEEYNRLLHSDNQNLLRMYQEAYQHLILILEVDEDYELSRKD